MEKLLVATYHDDLHQFEMFCYCLDRFWQGNRFITIVLNSSSSWNEDFESVQKIITRYLNGWQTEVVDGRHPDHNGYREQAVNKIKFSIDHRFNNTIVFDSKDFILRPLSINHFKKDDRYRVTFWLNGTRYIDMYEGSSILLDQDMSHVPSVLNLTPWIWNTGQLEKYWNYMINRFGHYLDWTEMFVAGTESDTYYAYTYCDKDTNIKFLEPEENPLLVGGGWTHQTYEGMLQEAQDFDQWTERKIWKHSRKLEDPRCLDVTRSVLLKYGIEREIIDQVFGL
jgi:hypothetical protein